jgi:TrpR family transcriptional regulator, trp operon repressor
MTSTSNKGKAGFLALCAEIKDNKDLDAWFDLFFTEEEKKALAHRYLIVQALLENKTQRQIAAELKVSIAKITRGSHSLKILNATFKKRLQRLNYENK